MICISGTQFLTEYLSNPKDTQISFFKNKEEKISLLLKGLKFMGPNVLYAASCELRLQEAEALLMQDGSISWR